MKEMKEWIATEVEMQTLNGDTVNFGLHKVKELVRCKDCKYGHHIVTTVNGEITLYRVFCTKPYVEKCNRTNEPEWFCADGERKDSE